MRSHFLKGESARVLLSLNAILAVAYFFGLLFLFQRGNIYLYAILIIGEAFHVWQLLTLIHAAWNTKVSADYATDFEAPIDVFITVAGEPVNIVRRTVEAAARMDYPNFHVYILNDGRVAKKPNWRAIDALPASIDPSRVSCITRRKPGGAKAGNINHALGKTAAPFVAILDCDHIPRPDFLRQLAGYMMDPQVAFVQSPQYYGNHTKSYVANAAWQQQTLFFGPICRGKAALNALFMCGTNMLIRRSALDSVGGMNEQSITEDLLTSLLIHANGWKSVYVPRIVAEGLAPEDLRSFWQQQFRWARGSLEVLMKYNPLTLKGLTIGQRIQYLASVTYYLTGLVVLADAILPLFYFYGNYIPISSTTMAIALIFVPYIFITLYTLQRISNYAFSFRAIGVSIASWPIFSLAFLFTILRIKSSFKITAKEKQTGNYISLAALHIMYIVAVVGGLVYAVGRDGVTSSLITNASWAVLYVVMFLPFIRAALSERVVDRLPYIEDLPSEEVYT